MSLSEVVLRHRLLACVGPGGVGKTTLAASLALAGALAGRRAMVLTIDPARALGRALGVGELASEPTEIELAPLGARGGGSLHAGMLDQKSAWDAFIHRHAPSVDVERAIRQNGFYQQLSQRFAGSTEYVAVEELCRLHESGRFDLIVLDTPPAAHAFDFVLAAERIDRLLGEDVIGFLTRGRGLGGRLLGRLKRATGIGTFEALSSLLGYFQGLFDAIRRRAEQSRALLSESTTAFVLVTGPEPGVLSDTRELALRMTELGVRWRGTIQNRVNPLPGALDSDAEQEVLGWLRQAELDEAARGWSGSLYLQSLEIARAQEQRWRQFEASLPPEVARARLYELDHDLHSLSDLATLAEQLCPELGRAMRKAV